MVDAVDDVTKSDFEKPKSTASSTAKKATRTTRKKTAGEVKTNAKKEPSKNNETKTEAVSEAETQQESSTTSVVQETKNSRRRMTNNEFFSRDVLGSSQRDCLMREVSLQTITGRRLFNLIYERMDAYLHRPKEYGNVVIARDRVEQMQKRIDSRLTELENYINKRYKQVKSLYDAATDIETLDFQGGNPLVTKTGFSNGYSNRLLSSIEKIDQICYMAGYLEMIGQFDMKQESQVSSQLYRKAVDISKILMRFIALAVRNIRSDLRA
ncbi:hypothetical protein [Hydrogenovibrio marinus]|uniref:DUF1845 domain-containing protein n=1 Tax=Hydrogenovibrio marinus TaxID=28885 RepID=A0A066ZMC2_HYDMR|nr:hypothetical protein [Hydrogenovibrio marinus]KDN94642.1 hypothetical protein EI16_12135 [Hydrogenovibrio marinus]